MTEPKKIITFEKGHWAPKFRDAYDLELSYSIVDARYLGRSEEVSETTHGRLTIGASGSLVACWGLKRDQDLERALLEYGRRQIEARILEGSLRQDEEVLLTTYDTPQKLPFDPTKVGVGYGLAIDVIVPFSSSADAIEDLRDNTNVAFAERYDFTLLTLDTLRSLRELRLPCNTEEEFTHRLSSFAGLVKNLNKLGLQQELDSKENGTINLLGKLLRRDFSGAEINEIMDCLRHVNRLRQRYPMHSDSAAGVKEALEYFEFSDPIRDFNEAWKRLQESYKGALGKLLYLLRFTPRDNS